MTKRNSPALSVVIVPGGLFGTNSALWNFYQFLIQMTPRTTKEDLLDIEYLLTCKLHIFDVPSYPWWKGRKMMDRKTAELKSLSKTVEDATKNLKK
jgi:hypothetical protein